MFASNKCAAMTLISRFAASNAPARLICIKKCTLHCSVDGGGGFCFVWMCTYFVFFFLIYDRSTEIRVGKQMESLFAEQ